MIILALDSTAVAASVALTDDERLLSVTTVQNGNTHSETLLPMIEETLARFSLTPKDISLYACSAGPGSFTGVRIGVSTIKGLAFGTGIPCVGVSTLEALAYNLAGCYSGLICPVMNARRSQVYNALFYCDYGHLTRYCDDRALSIEQLDCELSSLPDEVSPILLCGDGYDITLSGLKKSLPRILPTPSLLQPQNAYSVAQVALAAYRRGETVTDRDLVPVYLRPCQAERERMERLAGQE